MLEHLATRCVRSTGMWRVSYRHTDAGWVAFDPPAKRAEWVIYLVARFLERASGGSTS